MVPNLVPRLFLRGRKDPGRSWSRATQILGGKLKKHLGRGGRVLRLENYNLCVQFLTIKFKFSARNHKRIRIYHYMTISILIVCVGLHWSSDKMDQISVNFKAKR